MGGSDESSDRRRAERVTINDEFAGLPSATYISDLSEYGVFIHTEQPVPIGTVLNLRFTVLLDDPVVLQAQGRVVRHQDSPAQGMGIEFISLSPEVILRINDVVTRQRPHELGSPLEGMAAKATEEAAKGASTKAAVGGSKASQEPRGSGGSKAEGKVERAPAAVHDDPVVYPSADHPTDHPTDDGAIAIKEPPPRNDGDDGRTGLFVPVRFDPPGRKASRASKRKD